MDEYIIHYGVKGMKWGVRKDDYHTKKGPALSTGSNGYDNPVAKMTSKFIAGGHPEASAKKGSSEKKEETPLEKGIKAGNAAGKMAQKGSSILNVWITLFLSQRLRVVGIKRVKFLMLRAMSSCSASV